MSNEEKIELSDQQIGSLMSQSANFVSYSLQFSLGRQYLDIPSEEEEYIRLVGGQGDEAPSSQIDRVPEHYRDFHFLKLKQVGQLLDDPLHQPLIALQAALTSCHNPGNYTLIFIISSDGNKNSIYLGIRSNDRFKYPPTEFVEGLRSLLKGSWAGTELELSHPDNDSEFQETILNPLKEDKWRSAVALTGIPSSKTRDGKTYSHSLDKMISGLRGSPFTYMVIAEPTPSSEVSQIIHLLRDLSGQMQTLSKQTLNETFTKSFSETITKSLGITTGQSKSVDGSEKVLGGILAGGILAGGGIAAIAGLLTAASFTPIFLLASCALGLPKFFASTKQKSSGLNYGFSAATQNSNGYSISLGKECINTHAQSAQELIKQYLNRYEQSLALGCWNVGVYLLAENHKVTQQGGSQLRGLLSGEKSFFEPIRVHNLDSLWLSRNRKDMGVQDAIKSLIQPDLRWIVPGTDEFVEHPLGNAFNGLSTPLNTEELALLVNFPQQEVPGIRVTSTAPFSLNPPIVNLGDLSHNKLIKLGKVLEGGEETPIEYNISSDTLAKHTLLTGITGSGKSTTCRKILSNLQSSNIPFLIIEPAKEEYVKWALEFNKTKDLPDDKKIAIYLPNASESKYKNDPNVHQLVLNPFNFVWIENDFPQVLSHIDRIKSILNTSLPMQLGVLPILLETALFQEYKRNWLSDKDSKEIPMTDRPTFTSLLKIIDPVINENNYSPQIASDLKAALKVRLNNFLQGWKSKLFNEKDSSKNTSWEEIFNRPVIINLSQLGDDDDKAFTMSIILMFLYEYRQAQEQVTNSLRHLTVVEEAHRVLLRTGDHTSYGQANPKEKVADMFANILSEIRAYGEGLLIVDQIPNRLIPDAIKNTNLKIVHRLVAADDRDAMAAAMGLTPEQSAIINRLKSGQAIVYGDQDDMAAWVKVI